MTEVNLEREEIVRQMAIRNLGSSSPALLKHQGSMHTLYALSLSLSTPLPPPPLSIPLSLSSTDDHHIIHLDSLISFPN